MGLAAASLILLSKRLLLYMYRLGGSCGVFFVFLLLLWVFSKLTHSAVIVKKKKKRMLFNDKKYKYPGTFLVVQWLRLCASIVVGMGSIPAQGTRTPTVVWHRKKT